MKKFLLILGIGIAVVIIAAGVVLGFYLGPVVKMGMEQLGPKVTQASVQIDAVDVSLLSGSATIKGLIVGNPPGYSTAQAFRAGTVAVSLAPFSVTSHKILIRSIHVESPEITYEGRFTASNLNKLSDNVNTFVKNTLPAPDNKPAPKIEVDDFLITGAIVHVNISGVITKDIPLPQIHLTDLGKGNDGLTPAELASAVLKAISTDTLTTVASSVGGISKTFSSTVSQFTSGLGGLFGK